MLLDLGLSKQEIKALGKEQNRVEKIIELQNAEAEPKKEAEVKEEIKEETKPTKPEPTPKPKVKTVSAEARLRRQFDSIKDENKPDQVKTLLKFGLSKKEIRALKYEKNRVEKILELMKK
jgi:DNA-binding transcriptional MerR regulator